MTPDRWLILGIGAVAAFVVYRMMVDPSARRPQFRERRFSRGAAIIAAALVFSFCALLAWLNGLWHGR